MSSSDLWEKIAVAAIGALIGFSGNYLLTRRKEAREPQRQLAYEKEISQALGSRVEKLPDKLKILYDNKEADGIYLVAINLENSGNTVIKNQYLRVALPSDARILDSYFEPVPQPEIGAKADPTFVETEIERRYSITHLERGQKISFRLIASARTTPSIEIHPFNEAGDVQLIPREAKTASSNRDHIVQFITFFILFSVVPHILDAIPIKSIADSAAGLFRLVFVILMIPHIPSFSFAVSDAILALSSKKTISSKVKFASSEKESALNIETQSKA